MNRTLRIYLFLLIALIVVVLMIDASRRKPLDWRPSYQLADKIPLGLYVLDKELNGLLNDSVSRYDKTPYEYFETKDSSVFEKESYLFINAYNYPDENSLDALLNAVEKGGTLFISSNEFSPYLTDSLHAATDYRYMENYFLKKDTLKLTFNDWDNERKVYDLSPVFGQSPFSELDAATTSALGYMIYPDSTKYICFVKIKFGKGNIFLHNQPSVFSNYSLLATSGMQEYAGQVLSYLPDNRHVVWFVQNQVESTAAQTPLSVIFKYPALRMVWIILLYGLLIFIFFTAKRRQRVVPVLKPLRNTTLEFTQTIGNLYYQEGDVSNIVRKKIIYFLDRVRNTYYIDTRNPDEAFIKRLQAKSGKDIELIKKIVYFITWFNEKGQSDENGLIRLNKFIDEFWDKSPV